MAGQNVESGWTPPPRSKFGKRLLITLVIFSVLVVGGWFVAVASFKSYLGSEAFRERITSKVADKLKATAEFSEVVWDDENSTASIAEFRAEGFEGARFERLELLGIKARFDLTPAYLFSCLREGLWVLPSVEIDEMTIEMSERRAAVPPEIAAAAAEPPDAETQPAEEVVVEEKQRSFGIFPRKSRVESLRIARVGLRHEGGDGRVVVGNLENILVKSNLEKVYRARILSNHGAENYVETENLPRLIVEALELRIDQPNRWFFADDLRFSFADGQLNIGGAGAYGDRPNLQLQATLEGVQLEQLTPKEWIATLSGELFAEAEVSGDFKNPVVAGSARVEKGGIKDLPLLGKLAKLLKDDRFQRVTLTRADLKFGRDETGSRITDLHVESAGLGRLEGDVAMDPDQRLAGNLEFGVSADVLRLVPSLANDFKNSLFGPEKAGHCWTSIDVRGTLQAPDTDLDEKLILASVEGVTDSPVNSLLDWADPSGELKKNAAPVIDLIQKWGAEKIGELID